MAIQPYINTGNASVANGSTAVTLAGVSTTAMNVNDTFRANGLVATIAAIVDSTHLTLQEVWPGTSLVNAYYEVWATPDRTTMSSTVRQYMDTLSSGVLATIASAGGGTLANVAVPIGAVDTGFYSPGANEIAAVIAGASVGVWSAGGLALGGAALGTNALAVTGTAAISGALSAGASTLGATSATTLAIGGAALGTNALAVTGTAAISGALSAGTFTGSSAIIDGGTSTFSSSFPFQVGNGTTDTRGLFWSVNQFAVGVMQGASTNGRFYIGASASASPDITFSNTGGAEVARITDAGNLGIGTTNPP